MEFKDAMTDLVEYAQTVDGPEPMPAASGDRVVENADGEPITLGEEREGHASASRLDDMRQALGAAFRRALGR